MNEINDVGMFEIAHSRRPFHATSRRKIAFEDELGALSRAAIFIFCEWSIFAMCAFLCRAQSGSGEFVISSHERVGRLAGVPVVL